MQRSRKKNVIIYLSIYDLHLFITTYLTPLEQEMWHKHINYISGNQTSDPHTNSSMCDLLLTVFVVEKSPDKTPAEEDEVKGELLFVVCTWIFFCSVLWKHLCVCVLFTRAGDVRQLPHWGWVHDRVTHAAHRPAPCSPPWPLTPPPCLPQTTCPTSSASSWTRTRPSFPSTPSRRCRFEAVNLTTRSRHFLRSCCWIPGGTRDECDRWTSSHFSSRLGWALVPNVCHSFPFFYFIFLFFFSFFTCCLHLLSFAAHFTYTHTHTLTWEMFCRVDVHEIFSSLRIFVLISWE